MKRGKDLSRLTAILLSALTALLALALCWAAADIWLQGSIRRRADPAAVIYSAEAVRVWAIRILPLLLLWLLSLAACCRTASRRKVFVETCSQRQAAPIPVSPALRRQRGVLLALAALLILLGVLNGGARDVLTKAVNLCTECIGLG